MRKAIFSFIVAAALTGTIGANADAQEVSVKKGDTLWSISQGYKVSVEQVKKWNHLSSNTIYPDQQLKVSPERKQYIVKKGDTLWKIARENGVSVDNLKDWNHLQTDLIFPNQKIAFDSLEGSEGSLERQKESLGKTLTVKSTAYTAYCEGCSGVTKTGVNLRKNPNEKVIAVDPNVIPLGSKVHVEGYGYATAEDIGGAIDGNEIDIFFPEEHTALNWGVKSVKVSIIN
ncbi:LysM peptidoglycan-binding domain-containing protein [Peribacillus cavernae]|uniref:LysM peptidoglycan-binding domain-containing protein n=1 Tax=Peribacillus cavernae TaxID=1674310 RepID=A0A3S1BCE3_9BACI|nr:3D domain-containing protein [Peribacillus cavernae]MDQ0218053.1 3D (Asp-Asp-Asp) domain-containing protein/LysM repeat protein [Peribacillus cavernae]RUQ32786.1 LysM peptidoglycan-binding domain-containing protein [Peribacillus cavernae]